VVITIFTQRLNICSPKLGEWRRHFPPPGYAPGKSYWWPPAYGGGGHCAMAPVRP